jgi:threonine/homoserine/homoserine lactone efflux protein
MTFEIWALYVATVLALMSTPGPSQLLMLSNSASHGFRRSLATAAGDLTANALQMIAAGFGLAALIAASGNALAVIKWFGVAYLIWLGIRMIRKADPYRSSQMPDSTPIAIKTLWLQGFITSAANPKAIVFFAALFPQFIQPDRAFGQQFLILSATYIVMDGVFLSAYGAGASWIAQKFKGGARAWIERIGGGFMIGAAILLGMKTLNER